MEKIAGNPRPLALPVQPDPARAVMEMIIAYHDIDRGMQLDPADLCSRKISFIIDMMNVISLDDGKNTTQISDDTGLSAVMDLTAADDMMGSDRFLAPAVQLCDQRTVSLRLCTILILAMQPFIIISLLHIFSEGDPRTLGM